MFRNLTRLLRCKRIRTTAYHPKSNGLVERFHRQLKNALKAQYHPDQWTEALPLVLLGIRSSLKADLNCSAADMVFGTPLSLPCEFIEPLKSKEVPDPSNYAERLRQHMAQLQPALTRPSVNNKSSYVHKDLNTCTHVWVRTDAVRKPLQAPYKGPFKVIRRTPKYFILDINGEEDSVSLERLKVAYLSEDFDKFSRAKISTSPESDATATKSKQIIAKPSPPERPVYKTRSGRQVHWPKKFLQVIRFDV